MIILGSARPDGHTGSAVAELRQSLSVPAGLLDLSALKIHAFTYNAAGGDHFDGIVERMLAARAILFATPVYWYAMSGRMKMLFDRFTDLLSDRDHARRARALAGRRIWALVVGTDPEAPPGFYEPFRLTADYLEMDWRGGLYVSSAKSTAQRQALLSGFAAQIEAALG